MTPNVLLVDASNLFARAYYAAKISTTHGVPSRPARHCLASMVRTLIRECDPVRRVAALDVGKSWRHRAYPAYKAHRAEKNEEFKAFLREAPEILVREAGFELYHSPDFEADDTLATLADQLLPQRVRTIVVSDDRDLLALAVKTGPTSGTYILRKEQGVYRAYGPDEVLADPRTGVLPQRLPLFRALAGDASDGLPGCRGVGPVMARGMVANFPSAKKLWAGRGALTRRERGLLEAAGKDELLLSEQLCTLSICAPLERI